MAMPRAIIRQFYSEERGEVESRCEAVLRSLHGPGRKGNARTFSKSFVDVAQQRVSRERLLEKGAVFQQASGIFHLFEVTGHVNDSQIREFFLEALGQFRAAHL